MSGMSDPKYLMNEQYRDSSKLQSRIDLHTRFSVNSYGWFRWVFDRLDLPPAARILELGCGPGRLWLENMGRIPPGWSIYATDFSPGMVRKFQTNLGNARAHPTFAVVDARAIPFQDRPFDAVLANHMLYHVPERGDALAQIKRVLKPEGRLFATTVGAGHLREFRDLVIRFDRRLVGNVAQQEIAFTLESGPEELAAFFSSVTVEQYEDALLITESEPLVDALLSSKWFGLSPDRRDDFARFVERELAGQGGTIRVSKNSGLLQASQNG